MAEQGKAYFPSKPSGLVGRALPQGNLHRAALSWRCASVAERVDAQMTRVHAGAGDLGDLARLGIVCRLRLIGSQSRQRSRPAIRAGMRMASASGLGNGPQVGRRELRRDQVLHGDREALGREPAAGPEELEARWPPCRDAGRPMRSSACAREHNAHRIIIGGKLDPSGGGGTRLGARCLDKLGPGQWDVDVYDASVRSRGCALRLRGPPLTRVATQEISLRAALGGHAMLARRSGRVSATSPVT